MKSPPSGLKIHNVFWTLGQYDFVIIYEAPNEKEALKIACAPEGTEVSEPKVEVVEEKLPEPPIERVEVKETDSFQAQKGKPAGNLTEYRGIAVDGDNSGRRGEARGVTKKISHLLFFYLITLDNIEFYMAGICYLGLRVALLSTKVIMTFHEKFRQYDLGEGHPFRGDRFANAMRFFESQGLFSLSEVALVAPQPASREELLRIHDQSYVDLIFRLANESKPYDIETPVSPAILEATLLIAGGAIECGKAVCEGKVKRAISIGGGYHHAGRDYGGGFCLFNDIAVLVEHLRAKHGIKRLLILDYDVHFGNGTSDIYYQDPSVLYISLHQDPRTIYPGTGFAWQIGEGAGEGYNVNVPLPPETGDNTYLYALNEIFVPLAEEFKPEIVIANGGSDPHFADTLGNLSLTVKGFFDISRLIRATTEKVCGGKLVLMPGSGYNPQVLPLCWYALVAGVVGLKEINVKDPYNPPEEPPFCRKKVESTIDELKSLLKKKWAYFR